MPIRKRAISLLLCIIMMMQMLPAGTIAYAQDIDDAQPQNQESILPSDDGNDGQVPGNPEPQPAPEANPEPAPEANPEPNPEAEPDEDGEPAPLAEPAPEAEYVMTVNGNPMADGTVTVNVAYGETLCFSLTKGGSVVSDAMFLAGEKSAVDNEDMPYFGFDFSNPLGSVSPCGLEIGQYYVIYRVALSGGAYDRGPEKAFLLNVVPAKLSAPVPTWDGTKLSWTEVDTSEKGILKGDHTITYSVDVNGTAASVSGTEYGFTASDAGKYVFKVTAVTDDETHYLNSDTAEISYTIPEITVKADGGATANTPSFVLGIGETKDISVSVKDGYEFAGWSVAPENNAVTVGKSSVTYNEAYKGDAAVTVTALTKDVKHPVNLDISGDNNGLKGSAKDNETGIAAYAFATAEPVETEWQLIAEPENEIYCELKISAIDHEGDYRLYVRDAAGNTSVSENFITVRKAVFNYYDGKGTVKDAYIVNAAAFKLPNPTRAGYNFVGWFSGETKVESFDTGIVTPLDAKWEKQSINAVQYIDGNSETDEYSETYDAQAHELSVMVSGVTGKLSYEWQKDGELLADKTESSISVKNAADSGKYSVTITLTDDEGYVVNTATAYFDVAIARKTVTVTAKDVELVYGDIAPTSFAVENIDGVFEGEEGEVSVSFSGSYKLGDAADDYDITVKSFDAANYKLPDDYDFDTKVGNIHVKPLETEYEVVFAEPDAVHVYTGEEIEPELIVKEKSTGKLLYEGADKDYTVHYENNVNAGIASAKAVVTFVNNYSGREVERSFTIKKAPISAAVVVNGVTEGKASWVYDKNTKPVSVTAVTPADADTAENLGTVTYEYAAATAEGAEADFNMTSQPINAGNYLVRAVISGSDNYAGCTTAAAEFTIEKRTVTFTARNGEWVYDGSEHSLPAYDMDGSFAKGDNYRSVTVTGSITNVGTAYNEVNVVLSSATVPENYNIVRKCGELKVTPLKLNTPSVGTWLASPAGTVQWTPLSYSGLKINYKLTLVAVNSEGETELATVISESGNKYAGFGETIRTHALTAAPDTTYSFKIQALVAEDVPAEEEGKPSSNPLAENYTDSDCSALIGKLPFVKVVLDYDSEKIASVTPNGAILLAGESADFTAAAKDGYAVKDWTLTVTPDNNSASHTAKVSGELSDTVSVAAKSADPKSAVATLKITDSDRVPSILSFDADYIEGSSTEVNFSFSLSDTIGLSAYVITDSETAPENADAWTAISGTTFSGTQKVEVNFGTASEKQFYLFVKDTAGNIVRTSVDSDSEDEEAVVADPISLYKISFAGGTAGDTAVTGEMASAIKIENKTIILPTNAYAAEGYYFLYWKDGNGVIYGDKVSFSTNAGTTLTAQWTNNAYTYTVEHYFMDTDGENYSIDPQYTNEYHAVHGDHVNAADYRLVLEGFEFSQEKTAQEQDSAGIVIDKDDIVVKLYYTRNIHKVKYSFTYPENATPIAVNGSVIKPHEDTYYYGQSLENAFTTDSKPQAEGYAFVGWNFGATDSGITEMPDSDITVTGVWAAADAKYYVHLYYQDIDASTGELKDSYSLSRTIAVNAVQDLPIDFAPSFYVGYKPAKYNVVKQDGYTAPAKLTPDTADIADSYGALNADGNKIHLNVLYDRKCHNVTLNVWTGNVGSGERTYTKTWEKVYYGTELSEDYYGHYNETDGEKWAERCPDGYYLYDIVVWSTNERTMPDGNVTITRQFIKNLQGKYNVNVWIEGEDDNCFQKSTFIYYGNVGSKVAVGNGEGYPVDLDILKLSITDYNRYDLIMVSQDDIDNHTYSSVKSSDTLGVSTPVNQPLEQSELYITNTERETNPDAPLEINIYYARKYIDVTINYHYNDLTDSVNHRFATVTKSVKWGEKHPYNIEPLAFFDGVAEAKFVDEATIKVVDGDKQINVLSTAPSTDFRAAYYVVSYVKHAENGHYRFDSVDSVADAATDPEHVKAVTFKHDYENYTYDVYYNLVEPLKMYVLSVNYTNSSLYYVDKENKTATTDDDVFNKPLTYPDPENDVELPIYVANEAWFYKNVDFTNGSDSKVYPGISRLNVGEGGKFVYSTDDSNLRDGFAHLQTESGVAGNYFIRDGKIYLADTENRFYAGHRAYFNYGSGHLAYNGAADSVENKIGYYLEQYKQLNSTDMRARYAYVRWAGWGSTIVEDPKDFANARAHETVTDPVTGQKVVTYEIPLTITYDDDADRDLVYDMGGRTHIHTLDRGTVINVNDTAIVVDGNTYEIVGLAPACVKPLECTHNIFDTIDGYHIQWYKDEAYNEAVSESFVMENSVKVYGRYEKNTIKNYFYAVYETTAGEYLYSSIIANPANYYTDTTYDAQDREIVSYYADAEKTQLLMQRFERAGTTFSHIGENPESYVPNGFEYDRSNPANIVDTYCQDEPVNLLAHYKRNIHDIHVDPNGANHPNNVDVELVPYYRIYRFGEKVELAPVVRDGYNFKGWKVTEVSSGDVTDPVVVETTVAADKTTSFSMPDTDVEIIAEWEPAQFDMPIIYRFQNADGTFSMGNYDGTQAGTDCTIVINGVAGSSFAGKINDSECSFYDAESKTVWYFNNCTELSAGVYSVQKEDIAAVYLPTTPKQDTDGSYKANRDLMLGAFNTNFNDGVKHPYTFTYAIRRFAKDEDESQREVRVTAAALEQDSTLSYKNKKGMTLEYYYSISTCDIGLTALASDEGEWSAVLSGAGEYIYSKTVDLRAVAGKGYTVKGWYVNAGTAEEPKLGDKLADVNNLLTADYSFRAEESGNYIALLEPDAVILPELTITTPDLTFGYTKTDSIILKAQFPENTPAENKVTKYVWKFNGETVETYSPVITVPLGLAAGEHSVECTVIVERSDNHRSATATKTDTVTVVKPMVIKADAVGYTGVYDSTYHNINVTVKTPGLTPEDYVVYYSDKELTKDNYSTDGKPYVNASAAANEFPGYKDVKINNAETAVPYTVYYYVQPVGDKAENYVGAGGQGEVLIKPATLQISSGSGKYSRVYDGTNLVHGEVSDKSSQMYDLVANTEHLFEVEGFKGEDIELYIKHDLVLSCNAQYDSIHRDDARLITLSVLWICKQSTGKIDYNYIFSDDTIYVSGAIEPKPLSVTWDKNSFVYNGASQGPIPALDASEIIERDKPYLTVSAEKGSGNADSYAAVAVLRSSSSDTRTTDYIINSDELRQNYTVEKCPITVAPYQPADESFVYDGKLHELSHYELLNGTALIKDHTMTASTDKGHTDAGDYDDVSATDIRVFDENHIDVTENYEITPASGTITIAPAEVSIDGLKAVDKVYDGNEAAALDFSEVTYTGLIGDDADTVKLSADKVHASFLAQEGFEAKDAGENKDVELSFDNQPFVNADGTANTNYIVVYPDDAYLQASISKKTVEVSAKDVDAVYGDSVESVEEKYGIVYNEDDFVTGESTETVEITGTVSYFIDTDKNYTVTTPAGEHSITPVLSLSATNYDFTAKDGTLTIAPKAITIVPTGEKAVKVYDANDAAAVSADFFKAMLGDSELEDAELSTANAKYQSANASDNNPVSVTVTIGNKNYKLEDGTRSAVLTVPGSITPRPITVTAKPEKNIVYGDDEPAYTVSFSGSGENTGFAPGENAANADFAAHVQPMIDAISGDYDKTNSGMRNVGEYELHFDEAHKLVSTNYDITYETEKLNVSKAELKVKTAVSPATVVYGADFPIVSFEYDGFKYPQDDAAVVTGTPTYTTADGVKTDGKVTAAEGKYDIVPVTDGLSAQNYKFTGVKAELTVKKAYVAVTYVSVAGKVYDGTKTVADGKISGTTVTGNIPVADKTQIFSKISAEYTDANAGENKDVTVSFTLTEYYAKRINAVPDQTVKSKISRRPITVSMTAATVTYGSKTAPAYAVSYEPNGTDCGLAVGEDPSTTEGLIFTLKDTDQPPYSGSSVFTKVGVYEVELSGFGAGVNADNYAPSYTGNKLTVTPASFVMAAPVWDSSRPGTITWTAPAKIGDVTAGGYSVQLYCGDAPVGEALTVGAEVLEHDYAALIRQNGAGAYTVKVTTVTETDANKAQNVIDKNVNDVTSDASAALYAANVIWADYTNYLDYKGEKIVSSTTVTPNEQNNTFVINGDTLSFGAELINATGYVLTSVTAAPAANSTEITKSQSGKGISGSIKINELKSAEDIVLSLQLEKNKTSVIATVTRTDNNKISFGYSASERALFAVTAEHPETEVVSANGYTYTYTWKCRQESGEQPAQVHDDKTVNTDTWTTMPLGLYAGDVYVVCQVEVTRNDNGESFKTESSYKPSNPNCVSFEIERAQITAIAFIDDRADNSEWTYGKARLEAHAAVTMPKVDGVEPIVHPDGVEPVLSFACVDEDGNIVGDAFSEFPTDPGKYQVIADYAGSNNFDPFTAYGEKFTINKAQLATPEDLKSNPSSTHKTPYGYITWNAVNGFKENAGNAPSASEVKPEYVIRLYKGDTKDTAELKEEYPATDKTFLDVTNDMQSTGTYWVSVQAVPTSNISGKDKYEAGHVRCEDSAESNLELVYVVIKDISINGTVRENNSYEKVYDAEDVVMTVEGCTGGTWQRNGVPIKTVPAGEAAELRVKDVLDTANYLWISDDEQVFTSIANVKITPRTFTLTSADDTKVYDGTALKNHTVTDLTSFAKPEGGARETVKIVFNDETTGNEIVNVAQTAAENNKFSLDWSDAGNTAKESNYNITLSYGKLTITPRPLDSEGIDVATPADVVYNGEAFKPTPAVTDSKLKSLEEGETYTLASGTDFDYSYENNVNSDVFDGAKAKVTVTAKAGGNYSGSRSVEFSIAQRPVTFTGDSGTLPYNGLDQSIETFTNKYTGEELDGLVNGHVSDVEYIVTGREASDTPYDGSITAAADVHIYTDSTKKVEMTKNYDITTVIGTLKIDKLTDTTRAITTFADVTEVYDGSAKHLSGAEANFLTGETKYSYVFVEDENGTPIADEQASENVASLTKVNAGTYYVKVTATNPNYTNEVTKVAKLVIEKRPVLVTGASNLNVVYDGAEHKVETVTAGTVTGKDISGLAPDQELKSYTYIVKGTDVLYVNGEIAKYSATPSAAEIYKGDERTTDNYEISYAPGYLLISPRDIASEDITKTVTNAPETIIYTGNQLKPGIEVRDTLSTVNKVLGDADYTVSYGENKTVADGGTVTVTGKGNYTGSATLEFAINPKNIASVDVAEIKTVKYAGTKYEPKPAVSDEVTDAVLAENVDFTYSYGDESHDNIHAASDGSVTVSGIGNYTGTKTVYFDIDPRAVTIEFNSDTKPYDGTMLPNKDGYTDGGDKFVDGEGIEISSYVHNGGITNYAENGDNVAEYVFKSGTIDTDYIINVTDYGTLTITQRDLSAANTAITAAVTDSFTYDGTEKTVLNINVVDSGLATAGDYTLTPADYVIKGDYLNNIAAGENTASVVIKAVEGGNYTGERTVSFSIAKRDLTVKVADREDTYNGTTLYGNAASSDSLAVSGFVAGHNVVVAYTPSSGMNASANAYDNGSFTSIKVYDDSAIAVEVTDNYNILPTKGKLTIVPVNTDLAALISLDKCEKKYNAQPQATDKSVVISKTTLAKPAETKFEYSFDGVNYVDHITDLEKTNAGTYKIYVRVTNDNFAPKTVVKEFADAFVITKRDIYLKSADDEKIYDGTPLTNGTVTVTGDGFVGNENISISVEGTITDYGTDGKAQNTFKWTYENDEMEGNYNIVPTYGTLTIKKRPIEFKGVEKTDAVYTGSKQSISGVVISTLTVDGVEESALLPGSEHNVVYTAEGTDATTHTGSITAPGAVVITKDGVNVTNNYDVTTTLGKLVIAQKPVTFKSVSESKPYTGSIVESSKIEVDGLVDGHGHNFTYYAYGVEAGPHLGSIIPATDIIIKDAAGNVVTHNYAISTENEAVLTITAADIDWAIVFNDLTVEYDSAYHILAPATTTSISGTDSITYSLTEHGTYTTDLDSLSQTEAGEYKVFVKASNPNYSIPLAAIKTLTITPKPVSVEAVDKSKVYGQNDPEFTADVTGTLNGDTVAYSFTREAGEDVGEYAITVSGEEKQGNYKLSFTPAKLEITERDIDAIDITVEDIANLIYNGTKQEPEVVINEAGLETDKLTNGKLSEGTDYTLEYKDNLNAGTATVVITGIGNYTGEREVTFEIEPKSIIGATVTLGDTLYYDGTEQTQTVQSVVIDGLNATFDVADNTATEHGDYTMKITGNGNFKDTIEIPFKMRYDPATELEPGDEGFIFGNGKIIVTVETDGIEGAMLSADEALVRGCLTLADYAAVEDGSVLELILRITEISDTISAESKALFAVDGYKEGFYVDISLFKRIDNGAEIQLHETAAPVSVEISVPTAYINTDSGIKREYLVERNHMDVVTRMPEAYSNGRISFATDRFSEYAFLYRDTRIVRTGDDGNIWLYISLALMSSLGMGVTAVYGRRKEKDFTK